MRILFTLLLFCSFSSLLSQVYTSSCIPTPTMVNVYRNDVIKTATRRLFETNSTYKESIEIPVLVKDSIARVFYAIYNMPSNTVKDTILNLFGFQNFGMTGGIYTYEFDSLHIHNNGYSSYSGAAYYYAHSPKGLDMYIADTTTWVQQWHAGNYTNTNNPAINALAFQYGIILTSYYPIPSLGLIHITTSTNMAINIYPLNVAFNAIIGNPQASHVLNYIGDGNSIELVYQTGGIQITYANRCGDCPAGCQTGRAWTFFVSGNCTVQYLGAINLGAPLSNIPPYIYTCTRGPVLPVTFGSITGYLQSGKAALSWKVLTQVNVKEYVIERSDNGQQFYIAGTVAATHALTADYTWKDANLLTGTAWYRIKAVDLDGKSKYSSIVKISGATKGNSFTMYPNPVISRTFTVQFGIPTSGQMKANLYSVDGKKVWASTLSMAPQTVSRTLMLPATIVPGVYALVVEDNSGSYRQTLVISE